MAYQTSWESGGIHWTFDGVVTIDEVVEANREMYGDPRCDTIKYFIRNMMAVNVLDMNIVDVDNVAVTDRGLAFYKKDMKGALIATDAFTQDVNKRYIDTSNKLDSPWKFKLCATIEEARRWVTS